MTAARRTEAFLVLADRGLRSARILLDNGQLEDTALFIQQVAERVARALLTAAAVPFGTSHNLGQMADALPADHPFRDRVRAFDDLSTAVTAFRYSTTSGRLQSPPDRKALGDKLAQVEQLLRERRAYIDPKKS